MFKKSTTRPGVHVQVGWCFQLTAPILATKRMIRRWRHLLIKSQIMTSTLRRASHLGVKDMLILTLKQEGNIELMSLDSYRQYYHLLEFCNDFFTYSVIYVIMLFLLAYKLMIYQFLSIKIVAVAKIDEEIYPLWLRGSKMIPLLCQHTWHHHQIIDKSGQFALIWLFEKSKMIVPAVLNLHHTMIVPDDVPSYLKMLATRTEAAPIIYTWL